MEIAFFMAFTRSLDELLANYILDFPFTNDFGCLPLFNSEMKGGKVKGTPKNFITSLQSDVIRSHC